jgi:hypothetical protein
MLTVANREYGGGPTQFHQAVLPEIRAAGTGKRVTDRYLLGLVRRNDGQLATFDRALAEAAGPDVVCLLPARE